LQTLEQYGLSCQNPKYDWQKVIEKKDQVVTTLTQGIEFLFDKYKVDYYKGHGKLESANEVSVT